MLENDPQIDRDEAGGDEKPSESMINLRPSFQPLSAEFTDDADAVENGPMNRDEVEAKLFEQEHRWTLIVRNYLFKSSKYRKGDIRRNAIWSAFIWWLIFRFGVKAVVAGTGVLAYFNWGTIVELGNVYFAWEANQIAKNDTRVNIALANRERYSERLQHVLTQVSMIPRDNPPEALTQRQIIGFVNSLEPYNTAIEENGEVQISVDITSPERGAILHAIAESGAVAKGIYLEGDFSYAEALGRNFRKAKVDDAVLYRARLAGCDFSGASFAVTTLERANLANTICVGTNFSYAKLTSADLTGADLRNAVFSHCRMDDVRLDDAIVDSKDWLTKHENSAAPPHGLDYKLWEVIATTDSKGASLFRLKKRPAPPAK